MALAWWESNSWLWLVVKLYTNQRSATPYAQEIVFDSIKITKDIYSFDIAELQLPNVNWLQEDNKIEIYEANWIWMDVKVFSWFVYELKPIWKQFWRINITARSEKAIMGKRLLLNPINFYDATRKLSARPAYPESCSIWETILTWNAVFTMTSFDVPETWDPSYCYVWYTLVDTSYVYVSSDDELWKYETSLVSLWNEDGIPVKDFIEEMLEPYNTTYWDSRTVSTDMNTKLRTNRVVWDSIYDILDELANEAWAVWDIQDWVVIFNTLLWIDRTSGSQFQEIFFDWRNSQTSNIKNIDLVWQATQASILIYKNQTGTVAQNDSNYWTFTNWVKFQVFRDWNLDTKVTNMMSTLAEDQRTYNVEVEQNTLIADVWDLIKISVQNTNDYFNIHSSSLITNKEITYDKGKNETFWIQEFKIQQVNSRNWAKDVAKNIKLLQIKQTWVQNI